MITSFSSSTASALCRSRFSCAPWLRSRMVWTDSPIKDGSDEELLALFQDVDNNPDRLFIPSTMRQEPVWDLSSHQTIAEAALLEFFKRMRPGDPATLDNARQFLEEQLFDQRHYDLERVGRYKLNQKLDLQERIPGTAPHDHQVGCGLPDPPHDHDQ